MSRAREVMRAVGSLFPTLTYAVRGNYLFFSAGLSCDSAYGRLCSFIIVAHALKLSSIIIYFQHDDSL